MAFPLYKEWMGKLNRVGDVNLQGVREFIRFAKKNLSSDKFSCPCKRCKNGKCLDCKMVELHLVQWGFVDDYVFWKFHGERKFPFVSNKYRLRKPLVPKVIHYHVQG